MWHNMNVGNIAYTCQRLTFHTSGMYMGKIPCVSPCWNKQQQKQALTKMGV